MNINRHAPATASAEAYLEAESQVLWSILSDFRSWPTWNKDVGRMAFDGPVEPGTEFQWTAGGLPIRSTLREVLPGRRLAWNGVAPMLGIRAVHTWSFEPDGTGTLVRTEESFDGLIPRLFPGSMSRILSTSLTNSLSALRAEVDRRAQVG